MEKNVCHDVSISRTLEQRPTLCLEKRANLGKLYSFDKHGLILMW